MWLKIHQGIVRSSFLGADPEGAFYTKFFKKFPKLAKTPWGRAPEAPAPPPFSNPGSAPDFHISISM